MAEHFHILLLLMLAANLWYRYCYLYLTDGEFEAQKGEATQPKLHSWLGVTEDPNPGLTPWSCWLQSPHLMNISSSIFKYLHTKRRGFNHRLEPRDRKVNSQFRQIL